MDDFDGVAAEEGAQEVAAGAAGGVVGVGGALCCVGRVGRPQFGEIECPSIAQSDWLCHCSRGGTDSLPPLRLCACLFRLLGRASSPQSDDKASAAGRGTKADFWIVHFGMLVHQQRPEKEHYTLGFLSVILARALEE